MAKDPQFGAAMERVDRERKIPAETAKDPTLKKDTEKRGELGTLAEQKRHEQEGQER